MSAVKAISVWNPWAPLIVTGHKRVETRSWPAPKALIGSRICIASTKSMRREQLAAFAEPSFQAFYRRTTLADLQSLPRGAILGSVILTACDLMTPELIEQTDPQERLLGFWSPNRFAWRLSEPRMLTTPIPVRGRQGIFEFEGEV